MDKEIRDNVDNVVRFIPIKKLRDSLRELLFRHFENSSDLKNLSDIKNLLEFSIFNEPSDNFVVKGISGGLSDQINHYFFGRHIELIYGRKVKYDISCYIENINGVRSSNRNFELLNLFPNLNLEVAKDFEVYVYKKNYNTKGSKHTLEQCLNNMRQVYIERYLASVKFDEKYLESVKKELDFDKYVHPLLKDKNLDYYNEIKSSEISIGIHIRRGDYIQFVENKNIIIPDENYFIKAIELISIKVDIQKAKLFFFSDSMDWVSEYIIPKIKNKYNYALIEGNDEAYGYIDLYLMMSTNHQIASVGGLCRKAHFFNSYKDKLFITPSETTDPIILEYLTF